MNNPPPKDAFDAAFAAGLRQFQAGQLAEAEKICRQILAQRPDRADAIHLLGVIALRVNQPGPALELISRAVAISPANAEFHCNLGMALAAHRRLTEAVAEYDRAISLRANYADPFNHRGTALFQLGKISESIASYRQALALRADDVDTLQNLGCVLLINGQVDEAIQLHRKAVALRPQSHRTHSNLALDLESKGLLDEALIEMQKAARIAPQNADVQSNLAFIQKNLGEIDQSLASYQRAMACDPSRADIVSNLLLTLNYHPLSTSQSLAAEQNAWNSRYARPFAGESLRAHSNDRLPDRKLRVGYVSADLRDHMAGYMIMPLVRDRDAENFEVWCYYNGAQVDRVSEEFRRISDGWRSIAALDDDAAAAQIREDRIDILVDASAHMAGNRLLVFARKPAPVQVMFISYPGSTGLEALDYRLTDPYLDPPGTDERLYSEKTIRLPDTYWCFDPEIMKAPTEAVNETPMIANGYVSFGCLNNFAKVNDGVLELWASVMREVSHSKLLLLAPLGNARKRVQEKMQAFRIDPARLQFVERVGRAEYLRNFQRIDIALDTIPYNAHTTGLDASWMGVPTVTLIGPTIVGRGGYSQLCNLNLRELAADSPGRYIQIAVELARDAGKLSALRRGLRDRMARSPLCDARRWVAGVESAYRQMWWKWCGK